MHPEEKLAQHFFQRKKLTPPVDIRKIVAELADIKETRIPGTADAILLSANAKRSRPLILLQSAVAPVRKIFTLAHELGHIVIPWHTGTFVCHTDFHVKVPDYIYRETETEANRFASEILMPSHWIESLINQDLVIPHLIQTLQTTGVSALAATLALRRSLPIGYIFAEATHSGEVGLSGKSRDTYVNPPLAGTQIEDFNISSLSAPPDIITTASGSIYWWRLRLVDRVVIGIEARDSRTILRSILEDVCLDQIKRTKLMQSINGIVGAANGMALHIKADVYSVLKGRFLKRSQLSEVIAHPSFESFLVRKAEELENR